MQRWMRAGLVAFALGLGIALASCGDGDDSGDESSASAGPIAANEAVTEGIRPDGERVLADLPPAEPRDNLDPAGDRILGLQPNLPIEQYLEYVVKDSADFWARGFAQAGYQFPTLNYWIVNNANSPVQGECGAQDFDSGGYALDPQAGQRVLVGPYYCPLNGDNVYLPVGWLSDEAYGIGEREFALAYVVAHEVGHHVQQALGILPKRFTGEATSKQIELQADCLAGVWARSIATRNLLEGNDLDEAISLASELGDQPGITPLEKEHGTAEERRQYFSYGYETGDGASCTL